MVKAVIDLGTNSLKYVIAELGPGRPEIIRDESLTTRLGAELAATGNIGEQAMRRNLAALRRIGRLCQKLGVEQFTCVGAATLRRARDAGVFVALVKAELGWELRTLSGEEEARLTWLASAVLAPPDQMALVVDIGGGSTELTLGELNSIIFQTSLPQGALTLTSKYLSDSPVDLSSVADARSEVKTLLGQVTLTAGKPYALACGGSLTTLATVALGLDRYDPARVQAFPLTKAEVIRQARLYQSLDLAERRRIKGLPANRADIILAGALILLEIMDYLGLEEVVVSTYGLRHALLPEQATL